jgi:hypothetical protein
MTIRVGKFPGAEKAIGKRTSNRLAMMTMIIFANRLLGTLEELENYLE